MTAKKVQINKTGSRDRIEKSYFKFTSLNTTVGVNDIWDAFILFHNHWNEDLRTSIQEYRALIVDENNLPKLIISFLENRSLVDKHDIVSLFMDEILKIETHPIIIIAQNHAFKPLQPDQDTYNTSDIFYKYAKKSGIRLINHIVVGKNGYHVLPPKNNFSWQEEYDLA